MIARALLLAMSMAAAIPVAVQANEAQRLVGTWRLVSFFVENMDTGERSAAYGERPNGFIIATAEGRFTAIVTGQGRPIPQTDEQRATAFRSMFAYSGPFTIEGNRLTTRVEVSWNESWTGTDQVRFFRFEGNDRLVIETAPAPGPNLGLRMARSVLVWERAR